MRSGHAQNNGNNRLDPQNNQRNVNVDNLKGQPVYGEQQGRDNQSQSRFDKANNQGKSPDANRN